MPERDFQTTVLDALAELKVEQAELKTEMRNVVSRLDRLNGTVARHEQELRTQEVHLASRQSACPLVDAVSGRIRPLEDFITSEKASDQTTKSWMDHVWPIIWRNEESVTYTS